MISKFEAIGIFTSIGIMALALFLLRIDAFPASISASQNQAQTAAVAVVGTSAPQDKSTLEQTLRSSISESGDLEKLIIDDVIIGSGTPAKKGDTVTVHYIGTLQNGQEFDNSNKRGKPFTFTLGEGKVIQGWEKGILGMKKGGERILVIPPQLAYGNKAVGKIPKNATLIFSVKLLDIQ